MAHNTFAKLVGVNRGQKSMVSDSKEGAHCEDRACHCDREQVPSPIHGECLWQDNARRKKKITNKKNPHTNGAGDNAGAHTRHLQGCVRQLGAPGHVE